jgi:hypothetical protein
MEEAMVEVALDLNPPPSGCLIQPGVQGDILTNNRDQVQKGYEATHRWPRNRGAQVEALRLSIASGTYQVDTTELALCILRNSTHFLESR